jgi:hypothetical protein
MKIKKRYGVGEKNRLIIRRKDKSLTVDGRFDIGKNNGLIYWLNEPFSWRRQYELPNKIIFKGHWKLNANYDLELSLNETKDQFEGDCLVLKGDIIFVDGDRLVFEISSFDKQGLQHIRIISLSGFWQSDESNRISFAVNRETTPDIFTLEGTWEINRNQQIVYTYQKTVLKRKTKITRNLIFQGFWEINNANRLAYIFQNSLKSRFDFRAQLESPNLYPREGAIKYRFGVGVREDIGDEGKTISLYGTWKFSRKGGLFFQMDYGKGRIQRIEFQTQICLIKKDEVVLSLINKRGEPLDIYITFTHKFLKKYAAEVFLRLKKLKKESAIEAGVRIPF